MTRLKAHEQRFLAPFVRSSRIIPEVLTDFGARAILISEASNEAYNTSPHLGSARPTH